MIYICIPSYNHAGTVGLLLWKVRQVFASFPREYQFLVADDGSTDATSEVLDSYARVLPMTMIGNDPSQGYAATVEELLRQALSLSDRPKRDCAVLLRADFGVSPNVLPDLIRRIESGADVVIGEAGGRRTLGVRLLQLVSPWLLRPGLSVPGARDLLSGVCAIRLVTLKRCLRDRGHLLECEGACARAELVARAAAVARQVAAVSVDDADIRGPIVRERPFALALQLFRAGRTLNIPRPQAAAQRA